MSNAFGGLRIVVDTGVIWATSLAQVPAEQLHGGGRVQDGEIMHTGVVETGECMPGRDEYGDAAVGG
ncbi:hypothetical protein STAN_4020 [Streptomyces sp. CBMAI 2042]|nr:hypothetical protein STAN_4020 [Streptomyces sp. CBMAI 2042]